MAHHTTAPGPLAESRITDQEFDAIRALVYKRFGINLSPQKKTLVVGRLQKVLRERGFATFEDYLRWVKADASGEALSELADRISTNHTYFNREQAHFEYFAGTVLPEIIGKRDAEGNREVRIWCAGCSTGEEPYTLMMLLLDALPNSGRDWKPVLLATDISVQALQTAQAGIYAADQVAKLPSNLKRRYLQKVGADKCGVTEAARRHIHFRRHNLMNSRFQFRRPFDVIFCRNVMIYFDQRTRDELVSRYADSTVDGGYLFIGHSETLSRSNPHYGYIKPAVYRKIS